MAEITYNSWFSAYKRPFGAALIGTNFEFDLHIDTPHYVEVNFVMQFEKGFKSYEKMTATSEKNFHFSLNTLSEIGFYCYYFQII